MSSYFISGPKNTIGNCNLGRIAAIQMSDSPELNVPGTISLMFDRMSMFYGARFSHLLT